jgi:hypothetical protein
LIRHTFGIGAGEGNRTLVCSLGISFAASSLFPIVDSLP